MLGGGTPRGGARLLNSERLDIGYFPSFVPRWVEGKGASPRPPSAAPQPRSCPPPAAVLPFAPPPPANPRLSMDHTGKNIASDASPSDLSKSSGGFIPTASWPRPLMFTHQHPTVFIDFVFFSCESTNSVMIDHLTIGIVISSFCKSAVRWLIG